MKAVHVYLVCSGLGRVNRGFESFFQGCYEALREEPSLVLWLFKGAGARTEREIRVPNLPRDSRVAVLLGRLLGRSGYFVEQVTFLVALLPVLLLRPPHVVFISDVVLANGIRLLKLLLRLRFKVLYCNGGPVRPALLQRWDHIHQVSLQQVEAALEAGLPANRQTMLPYAVPISPQLACEDTSRNERKRQLGIPPDRPVVLSVGALSAGRKRMDYVIREVARMPASPFLLLVGAASPDTPEIVALGESLLSRSGFCARSVPRGDVNEYYRIADIFVLASLDEGFGLAYVEALSHGLPCVVHDYATSRYVLGTVGLFADLSQEGALAAQLAAIGPDALAPEMAMARRAFAYTRYSWDSLRPQYVRLFQDAARGAP